MTNHMLTVFLKVLEKVMQNTLRHNLHNSNTMVAE